MRGKTSKIVEYCVADSEVYTPSDKDEVKPDLRRKKKAFWNTLSWKDRAKRSAFLRKQFAE